MLLNDFFTISNFHTEHDLVTASITFDKNHLIFQGHFPGNPIVPGVCMIQLVREVMEVKEKKTLRMAEGDNIKFLSVINPEQTPSVNLNIRYKFVGNSYAIDASLFLDQVTYFKFKGSFQIV